MRCVLLERYGEKAKRFVLHPELGRGLGYVDEEELAELRAQGLELPRMITLPDGRQISAPDLEDIDATLLEDWAARPRPSPTPRDLDLPLPVAWFADEDWKALTPVVVSGDLAFEDGTWQAFYQKHRGATGWVQLGDVGFDAEGNRALIYVEMGCGSLCGHGRWYALEKQSNGWTITAQVLVWIS